MIKRIGIGMRPTTTINIIMYVAACIMLMSCILVTLEAVAWGKYHQDKYLVMMAVKDHKIGLLTYELNKAMVFDDWHLIWRYILPEIKRNEMLKEVPTMVHNLREYLKEEKEK